MKCNYLLGIDIGTSSTKTVIIDNNGHLISLATKEYDFQIPKPGWAEQNPHTWYEAAILTIREALKLSELPSDQIAGIGITGLMHGPVFLDSNGDSLRPSIIWADQRSIKEVQQIYSKLSQENIAKITGNPIATGFMLPTWLWIEKNEPEVVKDTKCLLLPKDYLRYRFTGEIGTEHSDASATSLYDPFKCIWSEEILNAFSMPQTLLPAISISHKIAGVLQQNIAESTKLKAGTPVVFGGSDQVCQAIGNGIITPGLVSSTIGTGGQLFSVTKVPNYDPRLRVHLFRHAIPDTWHLLAATLTAGKSLRWLRDNIFPGSIYQDLVNDALKVSPGADGLAFLPYLAGERTPYMDPTVTGGFIGLTLSHTRAHMVMAVLEGVVMSLKQGLEIFKALGVEVKKVIASGGATNHPLWLQLQADIFEVPIFQTKTIEAAAFGAALLAGVGTGIYNNVDEACQATVHQRDEIFRPNKNHQGVFREKFQIFKNLYPAISLTRVH